MITPEPPPPPHSHPLYTSTFSIPYSGLSPLNTLDIHLPTCPPTSPSYWLVYIHGGAFRDPLTTSLSLLPSLPRLFHPAHHLAAIASLNYRLSPYAEHPTHPSLPGQPGRNAKWPDQVNDVRDAVAWLWRKGGMGGLEWVVCGHSVGGTMGVMLGVVGEPGKREEGEGKAMAWLRGVVGVCGVYDFGALRDQHLEARGVYERFIAGCFGEESAGGWARGDVIGIVGGRGERIRDGVGGVVVGGSRADELVEWGQGVGMVEALKGVGREGVGVLVECEGGHDEVVEEGLEVGRCVDVLLEGLLRRREEEDGGGER